MNKMESGIDEIAAVKQSLRIEKLYGNGMARFAGKKFHFIGAGGIGMSGLAKLLIKHKAIVSGSDQTASTVTDKLNAMGASIKIGHKEHNLEPQADAVVISAAVKDDNPELKIARRLNLRIYKYAQMLGELLSCYDGIAVSGTHGKSTTSGWLTYCLKQAGREPNYIIGAEVVQLGDSSGAGNGQYFVAEACEYDRSFLNLKPKIGCILNIEQDHLDYYHDEDEIVGAFEDFAHGIKGGGVLIANGQDANVARLISRLNDDLRVETFGFNSGLDWEAQNVVLEHGTYTFDVYHKRSFIGKTHINLPGRHNVMNALAVIAMGVNAGLSTEEMLRYLPGFGGMDRRLMLKARINGITVLDDYAHHPTEIRASLEAIRQGYSPRKIWCVFQPHQYSRTRFLLDDFAKSFNLADVTIMPEIYFVRDSVSAKKEVNSQILVDKIRSKGADAVFIDGFDRICDYLKVNVKSGDLVVTMGAGDIWKVADEYIQWLGKNS